MTAVDERIPLDDWARLHTKWYRDPVLRAAASQEPACITVWPILVAMSKEQSHVRRNARGVIGCTVADMAADACIDVDVLKRALDLLVEGEFITYSAGRLGTLEIAIRRFPKWQTPKGSKAERDQRSRSGAEGARAGENASQGDGSATGARQQCDTDVDRDLDLDLDRDLDLDVQAHGAQGEGVVLQMPTDGRSVNGAIRRAKGQLGPLTLNVEGILSRNTSRPSLTKELNDFWLPAANLLADHGHDTMKRAFAIAAKDNAFSMKYVGSICSRMAQDAEARTAVGSAARLDPTDLAALETFDGGDDDA